MIRSLRRQLRAWKREFLGFWGRLRSFYRVCLGIILAFAMVGAAERFAFKSLKIAITEERDAQKEKEIPEVVTRPEDDPDTQELGVRLENAEERIVKTRETLKKTLAAWPRFGMGDKGPIVTQFGGAIAQAKLTPLAIFDSAQTPSAAAQGAKEAASRKRTSAAASKADEKGKDTQDGKDDKEKTAPAPKAPAVALETVEYTYSLAGSFSEIRDFLRGIENFAYPARVESVTLRLAETASAEAEADADAKGKVKEAESPPLPPVLPNQVPSLHLDFRLKLYFHD